MRGTALAAILLVASGAHAQWQILDGHTTADLRGIDNVGGGVAWASGTNGTVLRTEDAGFVWQLCAVPPGAVKLDFRGVQAFDNNTAIVMSSGPGDLSRLYKTTDGCQTWKLVFTNPDKDGFWDAITVSRDFRNAFLIGDPVDNKFALFVSAGTNLETWERFERSCYECPVFDHRPWKTEAMFAASNSILRGHVLSHVEFVTGGADGSFFHETIWAPDAKSKSPTTGSWTARMPLAAGASGGAFSFGVAERNAKQLSFIAVGGDYLKPNEPSGTAAYSSDFGQHWKRSHQWPHGYRSAVAYDASTKTWITVGPNGTDVSTDDGRNWRALKPGPGDPPDADQHWNALSLPFVVGPHGRIGVLRAERVQGPGPSVQK